VGWGVKSESKTTNKSNHCSVGIWSLISVSHLVFAFVRYDDTEKMKMMRDDENVTSPKRFVAASTGSSPKRV
jgi:hypothetical protein